jgi:hypothetical protein
MARIAMAWELGGGMGHVVPLTQIGRVLVERGHELHLLLRDLSGIRQALGDLHGHPQVRLWQAPLWLPQLHGAPAPLSYAELLFHAGYLDPRRLASLVAAWAALLRAIAPGLLVADHAPTALLASRIPGLPPLRRALLGTGFFLPPALQPMPAFREWERIDPQRIAASEQRVLGNINALLAEAGAAPLAALHELVAADESFLLTWPELDHYSPGPQGRPGARYWGALPARVQGEAARWPTDAGDADEAGRSSPKVFAYLKADHAAVEAVLAALAAAPASTLAYVPGLTPATRQRLSGPRLAFAERAVAMDSALAQAQAVVCNAGSGTVCTALQAGVPVLMLPMHAEQMLFARRVVATGAGALVLDAEVAPRLAPTLAGLVAEGPARSAARALAGRHGGDAHGDVVQRVADRCEALLET